MRLRQDMGFADQDPISIHKILHEKNILCQFRELDDNFSGMAIRTTEANYESHLFMLVNTNQSLGKQRFTACHELYHLLYQKDFRSSRNNAGNFDEKDIEEFKADTFATFFLLPTEGVRCQIPINELIEKHVSLPTVIKLEQRFRCSRSFLLRRLKELKLIDETHYAEYADRPMRSAVEYGYNKEIYLPTHRNEVVGDYNIKARQMLEKGLISQARYYELLNDMGIDFNYEEEH